MGRIRSFTSCSAQRGSPSPCAGVITRTGVCGPEANLWRRGSPLLPQSARMKCWSNESSFYIDLSDDIRILCFVDVHIISLWFYFVWHSRCLLFFVLCFVCRRNSTPCCPWTSVQ